MEDYKLRMAVIEGVNLNVEGSESDEATDD